VTNPKSLPKPAAALPRPVVTKPAPKVAAEPARRAADKAAAKPPAKAAEPAKGAAAKAAAGPGSETAPHSIGLPKRPRPARKVAASARLDMARRIVALAEDKKAADILLLDLEGLTSLADAFVICSGGSERQLESIADGIVRGMRAEGIRPIGTEGLPASHWILVDFGDVIVHIFTPPERDYYGLEKHWSEARAVLRVQ
jgi:ribosome-associated protein